MKPRKAVYTAHRWLGLLVSVQLLAWSVGGFMFSVLPIDAVRGERDMNPVAADRLSNEALGALPAGLREAAGRAERRGGVVCSVTLRDRGLGAFWELIGPGDEVLGRVDTERFEDVGEITGEEAAALARRDFLGSPAALRVDRLDADPPMEYRSGALPAYRVELDHPKAPRIYVVAANGEVAARRNRMWRAFDFLWMLHTMDYRGRDNFNHLLLTGFSVLAIATSASGLGLWGWRAASFLGRRRGDPADTRR